MSTKIDMTKSIKLCHNYITTGLQEVMEVWSHDTTQNPRYACFLCQQTVTWAAILDHVTSSIHRLGYMVCH